MLMVFNFFFLPPPAALLNYREDGVTPYLIFWRDGLRETKI